MVAKHKKSQVRALQSYVDSCLEALNLSDWRVHVQQLVCEDDGENFVDGTVVSLEEYRSAHMKVGARFFSLSPQWQRSVVAHELVHLYTSRMRSVVEQLEETMGKEPWRLFEGAFSAGEEFAVESLSRLLAGLLPLPRF